MMVELLQLEVRGESSPLICHKRRNVLAGLSLEPLLNVMLRPQRQNCRYDCKRERPSHENCHDDGDQALGKLYEIGRLLEGQSQACG